MAEEAHQRPQAPKRDIKAGGFTDVFPTPMMPESDARRRIVREQEIQRTRTTQPFHFIVRVVAPCITLQRFGTARIV
ncbi:MAG TPA: hypothetical protein VGR92_04785 [Steroidobacteraceae bacterium]|nr:hypothetical protein [Steroidobacteraceae bacterium]